MWQKLEPDIFFFAPRVPGRGKACAGPDSHTGPASAESEPSDDEMLTLSGQKANAGEKSDAQAASKGQEPEAPPPEAPPPVEEVDLLGLDDGPGDQAFASSQPPKQPLTNTDLLGDLFGADSGSTESTPQKTVPPASPSIAPHPRQGGSATASVTGHTLTLWCFWSQCRLSITLRFCSTGFDPFGSGTSVQESKGSFLDPGNVVLCTFPISPTVQNMIMGRARMSPGTLPLRRLTFAGIFAVCGLNWVLLMQHEAPFISAYRFSIACLRAAVCPRRPDVAGAPHHPDRQRPAAEPDGWLGVEQASYCRCGASNSQLILFRKL